MKKVLAYLPLHFAVLLILGILCQFYFKIWTLSIPFIILVFLLLIVVLLISKKIFRTLVSFLIFFFFGIALVFLQNDRNHGNYYTNHLKNNSLVVLKVSKVLKESQYNKKYEAEVTQLGTVFTRGKVLVNSAKKDMQTSFLVDDLLIVNSNFQTINPPLNPYQFNYKSYLEKQGIQQQIFLKSKAYKHTHSANSSWLGYANLFRNKVQCSLKNYKFTPNELAVINALLLGKREHISKELLEDYANAGAIHILAVSGLHVGIILLILSFLLKPLEQIKNGKVLKTILIVIFLWVFAFIAGLSASVVRAVTMFTFIAIGLFFNRNNTILFSLISSLFLLLIFNPLFLFDVGFQLSYLAVFGIVVLQPKIYKIWQPKIKLIDKMWQLTTVSLAAQIGVLPLSLYYFHQFPSFFILSNLIIVPVLGLILIGGILIITLALFNSLPQYLAEFFGEIISLMNNFVSWISKQEDFLFTEVSLSLELMLFTYLVIVFCMLFLLNRKPRRITYALLAIILLQGLVMLKEHQKENKNEFIVFHKTRNTIIGQRNGTNFKINHDLDSTIIGQDNAIVSYKVNQNLKLNAVKNIPNVFAFRNQKVLVVDSLGVYNLSNFKNQIILLKQSPKINLERLIKKLAPKQIIADGSNYKSYVSDWQSIAKNLNVPFHNTSNKGAFVLGD